MPEKGIKYLTTLIALSGVAALLVVIFHYNLALQHGCNKNQGLNNLRI